MQGCSGFRSNVYGSFPKSAGPLLQDPQKASLILGDPRVGSVMTMLRGCGKRGLGTDNLHA